MGGDTVDVLTEMGYSGTEVERLIADGAVFTDSLALKWFLQRPFDRWYESVDIAEIYDGGGHSVTGERAMSAVQQQPAQQRPAQQSTRATTARSVDRRPGCST